MQKKQAKKHFLKVSTLSLGSLGIVASTLLTGCFDDTITQDQAMQSQQTSKFVVFEETAKGQYKIVEEYPTSGSSRAIIRLLDGTEKLLSEDELRALSQEEAQRLEQGSSRLTQEAPVQGGLSMGEAILSSMAGVMLGNMLFSSLMGNKNFQQKMQNPSHKSPSARKSSSSTSSSKRSGFMKTPAKKPSRGFSFGG